MGQWMKGWLAQIPGTKVAFTSHLELGPRFSVRIKRDESYTELLPLLHPALDPSAALNAHCLRERASSPRENPRPSRDTDPDVSKPLLGMLASATSCVPNPNLMDLIKLPFGRTDQPRFDIRLTLDGTILHAPPRIPGFETSSTPVPHRLKNNRNTNQAQHNPLLIIPGGPGLPHDYLETLEGAAKDDRVVLLFDPIGTGNSSALPADMAANSPNLLGTASLTAQVRRAVVKKNIATMTFSV